MAFKNKDKWGCFDGMWVENSGFLWLPCSLFAHNCSEIWLQSVCAWEMFLLYTVDCILRIAPRLSLSCYLLTSESWLVPVPLYGTHCRSPVACWIWIPPLKGRSCHFIPLQPSVNLMSSVLHLKVHQCLDDKHHSIQQTVQYWFF